MRRYATCLVLLLLVCNAGCDFFRDNPEEVQFPIGRVLWTRDLANPEILDSTQPLIENGLIYAVAGGELLCLGLYDGAVHWRKPIQGRVSSRNLAHDQDRFFLTNAGVVEAYAKVDGALVWRTAPDYHVSIHVFLSQSETHLYLGGSRGWVGRIRKDNGVMDQKILLQDLKPEGDDHGTGRIIATEDLLYVPTGYFVEGVPGIGGSLLAYDMVTGAFQWGYEPIKRQLPVPGFPGQFFTTDVDVNEGVISGDVLVVLATASIIGLDKITGALRWEHFFEGEDGFWWGIAENDGLVYAGSLGSRVYALDALTGEIRWVSEAMKASILSQIEVYEGRVYVLGGWLYVLDGQTGETLWAGNTPDYESSNRNSTFLSPVAVGGDVMVNVGSHKIYALAARELTLRSE